MQTSIVPDTGHATYLVLDEIGTYGPIWREISDGEANEATIIDWIAQGQFDHPLRVVAFNTEEGWSHDMTRNIAMKLLDLNQDGVALGSTAREFVKRVTGRFATVIV